MSGFEFNKILAATILAIIVVVIIGKVGNILVDKNKNPLKETAYRIDIPESDINSSLSVSAISEAILPVSEMLTLASIENGEKIYKKCSSCHNSEKNSKSKIGPNLWNIVNRPKANTEGFAYSNALIEFGGSWTYEELNKFLYKPKEYVNGTKMNFAGLKKAQDRADLIFWLRQNSESPFPLP